MQITDIGFEIHRCKGNGCKLEHEIDKFVDRLLIFAQNQVYDFDPSIHNRVPLFRNDLPFLETKLSHDKMEYMRLQLVRHDIKVDDRWL